MFEEIPQKKPYKVCYNLNSNGFNIDLSDFQRMTRKERSKSETMSIS